MNDVFNTLFEVSLRVLLLLNNVEGEMLTVDFITAIDFITIYGKDFGISDENLHGDNNYKFSEFAMRRDYVNKAIRKLVINGFACVETHQNGFAYAITEAGAAYCSNFENEYAVLYQKLAQKTWVLVSKKSEREVLRSINRYSISSIKRGETNR